MYFIVLFLLINDEKSGFTHRKITHYFFENICILAT